MIAHEIVTDSTDERAVSVVCVSQGHIVCYWLCLFSVVWFVFVNKARATMVRSQYTEA